MPELPEVETTMQGIMPHVLHNKINAIVIRHHQLRWPIPKEISQELPGLMFTKITRRGKYILLQSAKGTLLIHLGMSANLKICSLNQSVEKHDHFDIVFKNERILRFNDPRRFGCILWLTEPNPLSHPLLKNLGPEPLENNFNAKYFFEKIRASHRSVKSFVMDGKNVVGVGNIYANEALFLAKIHPLSATNKLTLVQCRHLVNSIKSILKAAILQGGTTIKDFLGADGKPGYFKQRLKVYGRGGLLCYRCKKLLVEIRHGQRATVYCSKCQLIL